MVQLKNLNTKPDKAAVLRALGCGNSGAVYDKTALYFDALIDDFSAMLTPCAAAVIEGKRVYCLISAGEGVSNFSNNLFNAGEAMKGLLINAMADEFLFEADAHLTEEIKKELAVLGKGVKKRICAPDDFPFAQQAFILDKFHPCPVALTDAYMLSPVKSMVYILELTDDKAIFNAQHDCSKCACTDCPRRSAPMKGSFEIVSQYDYTPSVEEGKSAVCIDIGTTTIAFELISGNRTVKSYRTINPQRRFGLDVLSRIEAANRGRLSELNSLLRFALIQGYNEVTKDTSPDLVAIAGNTTMVHLLMNYPCDTLGAYPFTSEHLSTIKTSFGEIVSNKNTVPAVICGGISAFVGGDIVSGLYMCGFHKSEKLSLFIDLGTNGEMAIGNKHKIIATSTAAGPAFEGGRISCGEGSVDGAVCSVTLKPKDIKTINDKPPTGICGSGIIELLSEMKNNRIIDETGLLKKEYFENGFKLTDKVTLTQSDIREVQTAKAAVRAGIECLIREYGANYDDIDTVYLAGGFGFALSPEKAASIGILPNALASKSHTVGNSALGGLARYCSEKTADDDMEYIRSISTEFPLGNNRDFEKLYVEYMNF